jgi:hypothetical protein
MGKALVQGKQKLDFEIKLPTLLFQTQKFKELGKFLFGIFYTLKFTLRNSIVYRKT